MGNMKKERSKQALSPPTKIIWLLQELLLKIPTGHMNEHHDEIETDIPEFGGVVLASLEKKIQFDTLVTAFGRSPFVVHEVPLIAFARRRGIEPNVGFHGNRAGSSILGIGAGMHTRTNAIVVQGAAELGILTVQIVAIGLHPEASGANRNAIWTNRDAMVILSLSGITEVEIDEWND